MACDSPGEGRIIRLDDSNRTRGGILQETVHSLNQDLQKIYNINRENIHISFSSSANAARDYRSSDIISHCGNDVSTVAVAKQGDEYHLYINYEQEVSKELQDTVLSCGLQELENAKQNKTLVSNLIAQIAQYQSGSDIKEFYDENTENIQIDLQVFSASSTSTSGSIFTNNLEITVNENGRYTISIDSKIEENAQAHLLAHGISIAAIETNSDIIASIPSVSGRVPLSLSTIQEFYYNEGPDQSALHLVEESFIEAVYFYSRFHAYLANQRLKEEGLALSDDLSNEDIISKLLEELENKDLLTGITRQSNGQNLSNHVSRRFNDFLRTVQSHTISDQDISHSSFNSFDNYYRVNDDYISEGVGTPKI